MVGQGLVWLGLYIYAGMLWFLKWYVSFVGLPLVFFGWVPTSHLTLYFGFGIYGGMYYWFGLLENCTSRFGMFGICI